jgi:DNA polymerase I
MITIESLGKDILLFGRTENSPYIKTIKDFKPYFYIEDEFGEFKTIDGKKAKKIILNHPKDMITERVKYNRTYESDIVYTNRYIIDNISEMESENIRLCYIDIEIKRTSKGYCTAMEATNPILCIGVYDSFDEEYKQFCIMNGKSEKEILQDFINYINEKNPDVLIAWNGDMFDFPFLINRINKVGLKADDLGRGFKSSYVKEGKNGRIRTKIFGRILFDLMYGYKKLNAGQGRESWSLDYISKYELGNDGGKEKYKGELDDLYENDINKFLLYNKRDIELMILLNENLRIIDYFDELRKLCFCKFEDIFMNSKAADCLCLKKAKEMNLVLPPIIRNDEETFKGGYVREVEPKLYKNVILLDMKSLYPSIMIGFNISYETWLDKKVDGCISIDDKFNFSQEKGIIPSIVAPMLKRRKEVAKMMMEERDKNGESRLYKTYYMTQYALKVLANSFYGVLGFKGFRLYKKEVAESVTYIARKIIMEIAKWFEDKGYSIVYGDTDSVFIEMKDSNKEDMIALNKEINESFKTSFNKYGVMEENNIFKLEFKSIWKSIFFKRKASGEGAKKKYAGRVIWEDGIDKDEISIMGFESKRSDSPEIGRELFGNVLKMIVYEEPEENIYEYVSNFKIKIKNGEYEPERIGIPVGISKPLEKYGNVIHIRAARNANTLHNAGIRQGDKIKYLYVKNPCKVIGFKNYLWDGYSIDYDKMIRRIVDLKVGPIFNMLGWKYDCVVIDRDKKEHEPIFKQKELW